VETFWKRARRQVEAWPALLHRRRCSVE
jgi:hypothetical protein